MVLSAASSPSKGGRTICSETLYDRNEHRQELALVCVAVSPVLYVTASSTCELHDCCADAEQPLELRMRMRGTVDSSGLCCGLSTAGGLTR